MKKLQALEHRADLDGIMKNCKVLVIGCGELLSVTRVVAQKGIPTVIFLSEGLLTPLDLLISLAQTLFAIPRDAIAANEGLLLGTEFGPEKRFCTSGGLRPNQNYRESRKD